MLALRKPRALRAGATVGIAAPGGPVSAESLEAGEALLRAAGFQVARRDDLLSRTGYLAGDDARRAGELMELVTDARVDAIVCARGGYGCDRVIPLLDAEKVRAAAKPLVGYSDITALLLWQLRVARLMGFHGPMLDRGADVETLAFDGMLAQLCGEAALPLVMTGSGGEGASASGPLVGGSLTLVVSSLGTSWEIESRGAILLLEEVGERPYRVDRMLQQLLAAGKLTEVAAVGLGKFADCHDSRYPEPTVHEVIENVLRSLGVPFVTGLCFGHVKENYAWPLGARATLNGEGAELSIEERGVEAA